MSEYWFLPLQDYREKMKKTFAPRNSVKFETDAISAAGAPHLFRQYLMEATLLFERDEQGPENAKMHEDEITACNRRESICCSQSWGAQRHFQWKQLATRRAGSALLRAPAVPPSLPELPPISSALALVSCPLCCTHRCSWEKGQKGRWKSLWQVAFDSESEWNGGSQSSLSLGSLPESQSFLLPQTLLCSVHVNLSLLLHYKHSFSL